MGFKFAYLCDLLSGLENNRTVKASTAARTSNPDICVVSRWLAQHEKRIHDKGTDRLALFSCLFPERRTDRVYWLQDTSLARVVGRCLLLGSSRREELDRWRVSGGGDLGQCVENVMRQAENNIRAGQEVTIEEIDKALNRIASRCRFSGPRVRRQHSAADVEKTLASLYLRLSSRDAKWLTRMILKSYLPVVLPAAFILRSFHFLLPHLLLFQDSLDGALGMLDSEPMNHFPPHPDPGLAKELGAIALLHLTPQIGTKIGRPEYYKARSIKHCCKMVGRRRMSLERKYDGEYCQIHIDLANSNSIQIFSKSGKDSTADRSGIRETLERSLRIGKPDCRFSRRCILEGEILVWSDKEQRILGFHKLRKFMSRSGMFIGADCDSPPQPYEHLMIIFFDILLLDDVVCLRKPHRERRLLLKDVVQVINGRASLSEQEIVDFSRSDGQYRLERAFSRSIVERWEGYVLKACDEPYFSILSTHDNPYFGRWIKLKKDYIPGLGDTVDLALIGARYESRDATVLRDICKLLWTHFYIGCLVNKEAVTQSKAKPKFRVVDVIDRNCMSVRNMQYLNQMGEFSARSPDSNHAFDVECDQANIAPMGTMFKTPFVVEMLGCGFEKPSGARFFTLRFPRIVKIHSDRTFEDAASFSDLQILAEKARSLSAEEQSQEMEEWTKRLKLANGSSYIVNRSQSLASTTSSPSQSVPSSSRESTPTEDTTPSSSSSTKESPVVDLTSRPQIQNDDGTAINTSPTDSIAIRIEETAVAYEALDIQSRSLADYHNLAHQNFRDSNLGPVSAPSLEQRRPAKRRDDVQTVDFSDSTYNTSALPSSKTKLAGSSEDETLPCSSRVSDTRKTSMRPQSPLTAIPIYLASSSPAETQHSTNLNSIRATFTLDDFLQKLSCEESRNRLKSSNPHAYSQHAALGLVLINNEKLSSLSTQLYEVSRALANALNSKSPPLLPPNGKIFFLDLDILGLGNGPGDRRFCLRGTWENIGRVCFYASVTWGVCSAVDSRRHQQEDQKRHQQQQQKQQELDVLDTRVTISFAQGELKTLGEFTSIEPLVHFGY